MSTTHHYQATLFTMLFALVSLAWQSEGYAEGHALSPLGQTINQCDLIAMKAAAALPEALPFQRLEKAARQSHVVERCMQDRGYQENPAWVSQANLAASLLAKQQKISNSEAYETLRRQAMLQEAPAAKPNYWRKRP